VAVRTRPNRAHLGCHRVSPNARPLLHSWGLDDDSHHTRRPNTLSGCLHAAGGLRAAKGTQRSALKAWPQSAAYAYRLAMSDGVSLGTKRLRAVQIAVILLLLIVFYSIGKRFVLDMPHLAAGTMPEDEFDQRYVEQAWLAYLHIVPGVVYLFLAPLQLAYRIRSQHYTFHRRLGRVLATAGMISGVFALIFGGLFSFGGLPEASAAVVFGLWFLTCLVLAVRAIRRDDIVHHRRWMIRAFAIGIGIGTTRIWLLLFEVTGLGSFESSFGPAFWISFSLHVLAAELWLRAFPNPPELAHEPLGTTSSPRRAAAGEPAG
jgi:uncharacterized membrane protein